MLTSVNLLLVPRVTYFQHNYPYIIPDNQAGGEQQDQDFFGEGHGQEAGHTGEEGQGYEAHHEEQNQGGDFEQPQYQDQGHFEQQQQQQGGHTGGDDYDDFFGSQAKPQGYFSNFEL